ncbi:MAG: hypothetical protein KA354_02045 [Phycisphaerae bacterium]|nr:hypothetical protein [Phycisphaerae bacterium]
MRLPPKTASPPNTGLHGQSTPHTRNHWGRYGLLLAVALTGACQSPPGKPPPAPTSPATSATPARQTPNSNTDPCAMRLHDICGPLLLYYATHQQLPARIEELAHVPGFENVRDFTCPTSGQPYVYNPIGIVNSGAAPRIVLYDPTPTHSGIRWAISIIEPGNKNAALIAKVVALPESSFSLSPPPAKSDAKPEAKPQVQEE